MLLANSLFQGFLGSNLMGQGIVVVQLAASIFMFAVIFGKMKGLSDVEHAIKRFMNDFRTSGEALEYYLRRRPTGGCAIERIYRCCCERLLRLVSTDVGTLAAFQAGGAQAALTSREIELVRGTCDHILDEEELAVENGMGKISTVVALAPMLGLLGTVWGVLDAFAEMGTAGSANLATIAPSISAALVTTVVGLLIAIPGICFFNAMNTRIRNICSEMEGFADELMGRIACEFQGRNN